MQVTPMNLVNARRCKDTRKTDPNYYKNNRYSAKGTTILYNARNHTGPCRTSELCQGNIYLGETLKCNHDGNNTTNPNLASNTAYPTKDSTVKNARENLFCRGIEQPGWYGKCLYKFRNNPEPEPDTNISDLPIILTLEDSYVVDVTSEYMATANPSKNTVRLYNRLTGELEYITDSITVPSIPVSPSLDGSNFGLYITLRRPPSVSTLAVAPAAALIPILIASAPAYTNNDSTLIPEGPLPVLVGIVNSVGSFNTLLEVINGVSETSVGVSTYQLIEVSPGSNTPVFITSLGNSGKIYNTIDNPPVNYNPPTSVYGMSSNNSNFSVIGNPEGKTARIYELVEVNNIYNFTQVDTVSEPNITSFGFSTTISPGTDYKFGVGAPEANTVVIYDNNRNKLFTLVGNENSKFGTSISMSNKLIAIGAPGENRVYLYNFTTGELVHTVSNNIVGEGFGVRVALQDENTRLLVGDGNLMQTSVFDIPQ